jgi:C4-dicarboxylate-specific signal transduction histidine kinase
VTLQSGPAPHARPAGLTEGFTFAKPLSSDSQPFELQLQLATGPAQWPWTVLAAWTALSGVALAALAAQLARRRERSRAQALLRVEQVARLGALGEMAGGIAHELNQPLAAVLANAQAARRLLDDDPPQLDTARQAMGQAAAQARRAADVVARLRRLVESPDTARQRQPVLLQSVARSAAALLAPEAQGRSIQMATEGEAPPVLADPVALEQIVHNLVANAMRALEDVPATERRLVLAVRRDGDRGVLSVRDSGRGIAADELPHLFEPFYTTRPGGLGLGLSLCDSLARAMQGTLSVRPVTPRGAEFELSLPLAAQAP